MKAKYTMKIKVTVMSGTTVDPITFMGCMAGPAYNADYHDSNKNYRRGMNCIKSNHGRVMEFVDIYLLIDGISSRCARELMRHVGDGLTVVQRSTRYVNESNYDYYVPPKIEKNKEWCGKYQDAMDYMNRMYKFLVASGAPVEDCANLLPIGISTTLTMKKNLRNMVDIMKVRKCNRAYIEIRQLMDKICEALSVYSSEWKTLVNMLFKPKCEFMGYCDEQKSCGRYPKKEDIVIVSKSSFDKEYLGRLLAPEEVSEHNGGTKKDGIDFSITQFDTTPRDEQKKMSLKNISNDVVIYKDNGREYMAGEMKELLGLSDDDSADEFGASDNSGIHLEKIYPIGGKGLDAEG